LDDHTQPGSHWVSLYFDLKDKFIFYFDSCGNAMPVEIQRFINRMVEQAGTLGEQTASSSMEELTNIPHVHQRGDTECGMYSIVFVTSMLTHKWKSKPISLSELKNVFLHGRLTDQEVNELRDVYFMIDPKKNGGKSSKTGGGKRRKRTYRRRSRGGNNKTLFKQHLQTNSVKIRDQWKYINSLVEKSDQKVSTNTFRTNIDDLMYMFRNRAHFTKKNPSYFRRTQSKKPLVIMGDT
jgi:hypothetical protein